MNRLQLIALLVVVGWGHTLSAQQLFFETFSAYNLTAYDLEGFDDSFSVPLGFRVAGGFERIQAGIEYHTDLKAARFDGPVIEERKTDFTTTYIGGLIRANISSLPAYRFGLVIKAGAGQYKTKTEFFDSSTESRPTATIDRDATFGFNAGLGISAPIYTLLHWELGYMYHHVNYDEVPAQDAPSYLGAYHSFQLGLSLNLVFGNTAKKCRRIIRVDR